LILHVCILLQALAPLAQTGRLATLAGEVRERGTRDPVPYASVSATNGERTLRTDTDEAGAFKLELSPGSWTITILGGEWERFTVHEQVAGEEHVRYFVERRRYGRYETVVRGKPQREEVERRSLETEEIVKIPGTNGDALRSVENMPGVARAPFNSGIIVVRGSPPEDSLVLLDGHQLPQLYHFGGLTSVWNSDLIQRIDFLPGNASVRYGRFMGGVVDVVPRDPRTDAMHGYVNTNIFDTGVLLEGPVGGGSFALSGRRSYIDAILPAVIPADSGINLTTAPRYYDYQGVLSEPAWGGRLRLYAYGSDDELTFVSSRPADDPALRGTFDTHLAFHNLYASWTKTGDWRVRASFQPGWQLSRAAVGQELSFDVEYINFDERLDISRSFAGGRVKLAFGFDGEIVHYDATAHVPRPPNEGDPQQMPISGQTVFAIDERGWDWSPAVWAQVELGVTNRLTVTPGVRLDWLQFTNELSLDPRLTARYAINPRTSVMAAAGLFHEPAQPQFTDRVLGNPYVRSESAIHYAAGVAHDPAPSWHLESTAFYKDLRSLVVPSSQLVIRDGRITTEVYSNEGSGRVYGAEFLIRRDLARGLFGWLAYTISSSERRDTPGGALRPSDFDQTHVLVAVASWKFTRKWEAGVRLRYATGDPYTPVIGGVFDADHDVYQPIPGAIDSMRVPAFVQLDVRIDHRWIFERWMLDAYLDIQNATNRQNVEAVLYGYDFTRTANVTGLPVIPAIGLKGEF
jgi:hypothetical protein